MEENVLSNCLEMCGLTVIDLIRDNLKQLNESEIKTPENIYVDAE